jgi:hypothetical protein
VFAEPERDACPEPGPGDHAEREHQEDRPIDVPQERVNDRPRDHQDRDHEQGGSERPAQRHPDPDREGGHQHDPAADAQQPRDEAREQSDRRVLPPGGLAEDPRRARGAPDDHLEGRDRDQAGGDQEQQVHVHDLREQRARDRPAHPGDGRPLRGADAHLARLRVGVRAHERSRQDDRQRRRDRLDRGPAQDGVHGRGRDDPAADAEQTRQDPRGEPHGDAERRLLRCHVSRSTARSMTSRSPLYAARLTAERRGNHRTSSISVS